MAAGRGMRFPARGSPKFTRCFPSRCRDTARKPKAPGKARDAPLEQRALMGANDNQIAAWLRGDPHNFPCGLSLPVERAQFRAGSVRPRNPGIQAFDPMATAFFPHVQNSHQRTKASAKGCSIGERSACHERIVNRAQDIPDLEQGWRRSHRWANC